MLQIKLMLNRASLGMMPLQANARCNPSALCHCCAFQPPWYSKPPGYRNAGSGRCQIDQR
jgi:hypothetical protein